VSDIPQDGLDPQHPRLPPLHWLGAGIVGLVRWGVFGALAMIGAGSLLSAPALVAEATTRGGWGDATSDTDHLWLALVVSLLPCLVLSARWAAGRTRWAVGAAPLLPPVLLLAAVVHYNGVLPGGRHGVVWLAVPLVACTILTGRWLAAVTRRLSGEWCGVPITVPYRPLPGSGRPAGRAQDGPYLLRLWRRTEWLLLDPATWRDLLWVVVNVSVPWALCLGAAKLVPHAVLSPGWPLLLLLALWAAPRLLPAYGVVARSMLGPTQQAELALRVSHLDRTRTDTIDTSAAELRRIERDLHDGAQARLVALGMALDAAEQLIDTSPAVARAILAEAKDSSVKALAELRDLVRGIHPPVLADRGLADAVHALALDLPQRLHFDGELPGRPPAPVESAAYFAVSELLANVTKHAQAKQVWIDLAHIAGQDGGTLRIGVTDDGRGGADAAAGTGLSGVERRLAAFDGVLAVSSPPGGPTIVNMEIPCVLSSPKTSSS
jgi:signal transduction histidine kinase